MIKLIATVRRLKTLTHVEFRTYYETRHRHLVAHFAHCITDYRRSYPRPDLAAIAGLYAGPGGEDVAGFDVLTEIWFADIDSLARAFAILGSTPVREIFEVDESRFMDRSTIRVTICDEAGGSDELADVTAGRPAGSYSAFPIDTLTSPS